MPMLIALDWRRAGVGVTLTVDPDGGVRLALGHGPDELVVHLAHDSMDALTLAGLTRPRPPGDPPWALVDLTLC